MTDDPSATPDGSGTSPLLDTLTEIERHVGAQGWDQPARLYALAPTHELVAREPQLASQLGLAEDAAPGSLTPIEQEVGHGPIEDLLPTISWPDSVTGCALAIERIVLPRDAEAEMPTDDAEAVAWAQRHPGRADIRVVVGVLRDGTRSSVLRVRGHEDDAELIRGAELSPELAEVLADTFR